MQDMQSVIESLEAHAVVALYFSAPACEVCHALEPKLRAAIGNDFPDIVFLSIDSAAQPDVAAHFGVFTVPTLFVFFHGKEVVRKSRHMGIGEVLDAIRRPHDVLQLP
jgi:thioredoxin 1